MGLTSSQARHFYDRFGRAQNLQAFYKDRAAGGGEWLGQGAHGIGDLEILQRAPRGGPVDVGAAAQQLGGVGRSSLVV